MRFPVRVTLLTMTLLLAAAPLPSIAETGSVQPLEDSTVVASPISEDDGTLDEGVLADASTLTGATSTLDTADDTVTIEAETTGEPDSAETESAETESAEANSAAAETTGEPESAETESAETDSAETETVVLDDVPVEGAPSRGQLKQEERLQWEATGSTAHLSHVAHVIGADQAWANRLTGDGVGIALIDTGVAPVEGLRDVVHGPDLSFDAPAAQVRHLDAYGHGTHLAGIITSDRADARGMAPGADLLSIKVGAHNGAVDVSQVIAAVDWVVQNREEHGVRVLVLPFGTDSVQPSQVDPLAHAVEVAWRNGIVVVVSAGNHGEQRPWLSNPARDPFVISVAAADTMGTNGAADDVRPSWSAPGHPSRTPDISAPGTGLVSLAVGGGYLARNYPAANRPGSLFRGSGTSQAAAVTGAAIALLLEHRPGLTPDEVKAILRASARPLSSQSPASGAGMLSLPNALKAGVPADATQVFPQSSGTGSLEHSRGTHHLVSAAGDRMLAADIDIHGKPFISESWGLSATALQSWQGGSWNGTAWIDTDFSATVWDGVSWDGVSWDGVSWDGVSWDGVSWDGVSWDGVSWDGVSWDGVSWDGVSWDGVSWDGVSWDGVSWDGVSWDGVSWDGVSWDGVSWDGVSWDGVSWDGVSWDGVSWDGVSWDGVSWDTTGWDSVRWD